MSQLKYMMLKEYLQNLASKPESAQKMPTVRSLMKEFNISLSTVNKALSILENEGIIQRRQGQGIVSISKPGSVATFNQNGKNDKMILAYVDYPAKQIWDMVHYIRHFALQDNLQLQEFKLQQNTPIETLIDFAADCTECRGIVIHIGADCLPDDKLAMLGKLNVPVAIVDSMYFYKNIPDNLRVFSPDPEYGARLIAKFLYNKGHRKIAYIRNEPQGDYPARFQKALTNALKKYGINFDKENIYASAVRSWENSLSAAYEQTLNNINDIIDKKYTAIVYKSSPGAIAGMKVLKDHGLDVPGEIGVIGEGEDLIYPYISPSLTTVSADLQVLCKSAVDYITGILEPQHEYTLFPPTLNERESIMDINNTP